MPSETGASAQARSDLPDPAIRAQLERILASEVFSRSRAPAALPLVHRRTEPGRAGTFAQRIGPRPRAVREGNGLRWRYGSGRSGRCQAAPRQTARVLRGQIRSRRHLAAEGQLRARLRSEFRLTHPDHSPCCPTSSRRRVRSLISGARECAVGALALVAVVVTAVLAWRALRSPANAPVQLLPLASYPGNEGPPALSPDGNLVAFAWSGSDDAWPDGHLREGCRE